MQILVQLKDKYIFSTHMKIHTIKKQSNFILILNRAIVSFMYYSPSTVYFILRNHLASNLKETLFEFSIDKQHWKHSIFDKPLFILMFLSYCTCHFQVYRLKCLDHLEIGKLFNSLFSSVLHSFNTKTLVTLVELYFCQNSPVPLF